MRIASVAVMSCCLIMSASVVLAKEKTHEGHDARMDPQAMMELYQKLATPGEPHKLLASLAGSWTTQTKEWMEPGKPPTEASGTAEMKMVLDGRYLQQEYNSTMMGQPYTGMGLTGYDNLAKKFVTTWVDNMGTGMFRMEGTAEGDGKTITLKGGHPEPGGGHILHRAVWKIVDANTQTFEMYGAHKGEKESKVMEIVYTRKQ